MAEESKPADPGQGEPKPADASQQPAASASDDAKDVVSRAELQKVIAERQAAKDAARKAAEDLAAVRNDPRLSIEETALEEFRAWSQNREQAAKDQAMKAGDVQALETAARKPLLAENENLKGRLAGRESQLTTLLRDKALMEAAVAAGAVNPKQVVSLLRPRVKMIHEPATDTFRPQFLDETDQPLYGVEGPVLDAATFVRMFLADPGNANLVKAGSHPGPGAKTTGGASQASADTTPRSIAEFNALPPDQREALAASMTTEQRNALLGIKPPKAQGFV